MNRPNLGEIWDRVGVRPLRLVLLLVVSVCALGLARAVLPCDTGEKTVLAEFPQYGGKVAGEELGVYGDEVQFPPLQAPPPGCALEFALPRASPEQVSSYYVEELIEHGWKVERFPVDREGEFEHPHLEGYRDGLRYVVHYWPTNLPSTVPAAWSGALGNGGTEVRVQVFEAG